MCNLAWTIVFADESLRDTLLQMSGNGTTIGSSNIVEERVREMHSCRQIFSPQPCIETILLARGGPTVLGKAISITGFVVLVPLALPYFFKQKC